ncbi:MULTISPECIES: M48 family metallopeptidase [Pseudomonas]|uniref:M48 family metallopeptidase n=1 Tax=Pseudomonas TaxID=286 RepID=UPI00053ED696|nr:MULTISPECIES: SprT family zinc-dependent metalloprotease [Pseudomonas]MBG6284337.1 M48 family metallopeptidase [Pseudomonas aeruginosa]MCD2950640.1 M48 family metallopeptidase [Pseudomonas aeruginosa]MCF3988353.1 M48 family metallopeptidase [Pseudomonas aeruginosa]MCO3875968.1 M48 family metallopeptidase [Pseudomonas aeruginosa]MCV0163268.1 M48 family metallopeptidase [Pseudomonas aeruginosa]
MNTESRNITVSGLTVEVVRKPIKNLHLGVYPPEGRVRVAAPLAVDDEAVRLAVVGKLGWIKRQRAKFQAQPRQSQRRMVSGESHYFLGRRYRLRVHETTGALRIALRGTATMDLFVRPDTTVERREQVLHDFYRAELKRLMPELLEKWQPKLEVEARAWGIKRMKTKWGTCNIEARRIWLNLELAKKPVQCLEYILVHELVHLLERHHNERFQALLNLYLPQWQVFRDELNASMLADERWGR